VAYNEHSWALLPQPTDEPFVFTPGRDPDRLLLIGSGPAVGYGVLSHQLGLPGHLVRQLTALTGHPTELEVFARPDLTAASCLNALSAIDLLTLDGIVMLIGANETFALMPVAPWKRHYLRLLDYIEQASSPDLQTFVIAIPPMPAIAAYPHWLARIWDRHSRLLNDAMVKGAREHHRATFVPFTPLPAQDTDRYRSRQTYFNWAELLVGPISEHLARDRPRSGPARPTPGTDGS
jgi:hypothetical protein